MPFPVPRVVGTYYHDQALLVRRTMATQKPRPEQKTETAVPTERGCPRHERDAGETPQGRENPSARRKERREVRGRTSRRPTARRTTGRPCEVGGSRRRGKRSVGRRGGERIAARPHAAPRTQPRRRPRRDGRRVRGRTPTGITNDGEAPRGRGEPSAREKTRREARRRTNRRPTPHGVAGRTTTTEGTRTSLQTPSAGTDKDGRPGQRPSRSTSAGRPRFAQGDRSSEEPRHTSRGSVRGADVGAACVARTRGGRSRRADDARRTAARRTTPR